MRVAVTSNRLAFMRVERWFNVLVLGGASLGNACGREAAEPDRATAHPSDAGTTSELVDPTDGGGTGGSGSSGTSATSNSGADGGVSSASGGASSAGASSSSAAAGSPTMAEGGSATGGTGAVHPTGGKAAVGGSGGDAGRAGSGGSAGGETTLACHRDANGFGKAADPCGCACCWARDCLNTQDCCAGFCKGADSGRGCCAP